ncbi:hypothetical protein [Granulicella sp. S190]|uniref:hypothetical protein n=1 Tax=Granulicella sp. S190 TaxID=1747226 RepID=UPI00131EB8A2|nr:hypothetical protein [Granulicella sp. S190]
MSERHGLLAPPRHPVLSLAVQAHTAPPARVQSRFEVLVRHILHRFFHNELLASDDETKRVMQIAAAVALPTLIVSLFLFPAYHAFPPAPLHRPFWSQAGDHSFYVIYSFVVMGAATVYEWDLLFPDTLDIFVLSVLPIPNRKLFFARVLALAVFLLLVQVGTSILGTLFLPLAAEQHNFLRHLFSHFVAVTISGIFAAATFLSLQGILLNTVGEGLFRRITPLLQGLSIMVLLAVLLLCPTVAGSLEALLTSGSPAIRYFPPFWFLGIYEYLLDGASTPAIFHDLARTGCYALVIMLACTLLTYPLAYRRRVRQLIEGSAAISTRSSGTNLIRRLLHSTLLRHPSQRAVFHFISQTILRGQRQRISLAIFGGLSVALALAQMVTLQVEPGHIHIALLPDGIRSAIPIVAFFTVAGLRSVLAAPVDRRGSWLFRVLIGRPRSGHLAGAYLWISLTTFLICSGTVLLLHSLSPASMQIPRTTTGQLLVAIGLSLLLPDILLFSVRAIPFTQLHKSSVNDLPLAVLRYLVLFPIFVSILVAKEAWIEGSATHLLATTILLVGTHLTLQRAHANLLAQSTLDTAPDEADEFPQRLGLRDA